MTLRPVSELGLLFRPKTHCVIMQVCVIMPHLFLKGPMVTSLSYNMNRERGYPYILRMIEH